MMDNSQESGAPPVEYAASDHKKPRKWRRLQREVECRHRVQNEISAQLKESGIQSPNIIAATDVFVEKAQRILTVRAWSLFSVGGLSAILAVSIFSLSAAYVFRYDMANFYGIDRLDGYLLALIILKASAAGGFVIGTVVFLIQLARAMLHEATTLFNKRHALRFGRLYIHLKQDDLDAAELESAFSWNTEFKSAFRDIQPEQSSQTLTNTLASLPAEIVKAFRKNKERDQPSKSAFLLIVAVSTASCRN